MLAAVSAQLGGPIVGASFNWPARQIENGVYELDGLQDNFLLTCSALGFISETLNVGTVPSNANDYVYFNLPAVSPPPASGGGWT